VVFVSVAAFRLRSLRILVTAACGVATQASQPAPSAERAPASYQIINGAVDEHTYNGFRRYNAACNHCHGPDGVGGSFAPSLIAVPFLPEDFRMVVLAGRGNGNSVMPGYADDPNVAPYVDDIYRYLRARADGVLGRGRPSRRGER
jgi:mono/diheme cytochrome c family protein